MRYSRILIFFSLIYNSCAFYWRGYHGKVPQDALVAGVDVNGENVYIGQTFIANDHTGIYPTMIQEGKTVHAPIFGSRKEDNFVQILCSPNPGNFQWILTNWTDLEFISSNHNLITGGIEDNKALNIGRIHYESGIVVGKVLAGQKGKSYFFFEHRGKEYKVTRYEVLEYIGSS